MTQGAPSVLVVPWCTESRTTTLLREWQPGTDRVLWGVVAGMVEEEAGYGSHSAATGTKHSGPLQAAQYELDEEAREDREWEIDTAWKRHKEMLAERSAANLGAASLPPLRSVPPVTLFSADGQ